MVLQPTHSAGLLFKAFELPSSQAKVAAQPESVGALPA